jgi:hypothetical protein
VVFTAILISERLFSHGKQYLPQLGIDHFLIML